MILQGDFHTAPLRHRKYLRCSGSESQPCASDKRPLGKQYACEPLGSLKQNNHDRVKLFAGAHELARLESSLP